MTKSQEIKRRGRKSRAPAWKDAKTSAVLRILRRLETRGLVEQVDSSYARMLTWQMTAAGNALARATVETE